MYDLTDFSFNASQGTHYVYALGNYIEHLCNMIWLEPFNMKFPSLKIMNVSLFSVCLECFFFNVSLTLL